MTGVFLSYSRADQALAEQVISSLRRIGVRVWWDQDMPGVDWQDELAREIEAMVGVVVLWTPNSVASKNVKDEARLALHTEKLVNVLVGVRSPPFPFDRVNGLPIDGWNGHDPHGGWSRLVQTIEALAVRGGVAHGGELKDALARSEQELRAIKAAVVQAQDAFQDAQTMEAEAEEAANTASTDLAQAEAQLRHLGEISVTPLLLRAAQQEFEIAHTARMDADRAHRAARAQLSAAARRLSQAKADVDDRFRAKLEAPSESDAIAPVAEADPVEDAANTDNGDAPASSAELAEAPPVSAEIETPRDEDAPPAATGIATSTPGGLAGPSPAEPSAGPSDAGIDPNAHDAGSSSAGPTPHVSNPLEEVPKAQSGGNYPMQSLLFRFNGRIRRQQYWLATLGAWVVYAVIVTVLTMLTQGGGALALIGNILIAVVFVACWWAFFAIQVKRWHDRDKSWVWIFVGLITLEIWPLIECGFLDGTPGPNKFGPSPKGITAPAPAPAV